MKRTLVAMLLLAPACSTAPPPAPAPEDGGQQAEVLAVVDRLFDAMRAGDSATVRSVFHPAATLMSVPAAGGAPMLRTSEIDDFIKAVGSARSEVWDERTWARVVQIDGDLASAWMQYAFHVNGRLSHCGVNAFQLFRSPDGWRIIHIADTRRREGCSPASAATPVS